MSDVVQIAGSEVNRCMACYSVKIEADHGGDASSDSRHHLRCSNCGRSSMAKNPWFLALWEWNDLNPKMHPLAANTVINAFHNSEQDHE